MKLAITGSRKYNDYQAFCDAVEKLSPDELVSGGAHGADGLAERYANEHRMPITVFLPKFKTDNATPYHPRWYLERNKEIIDNSDRVLAFLAAGSKGTAHTIKYAQSRNKPITLIHI